jgi:hypothetical protein
MKNKLLHFLLVFIILNFAVIKCKNEAKDDSSKLALSSILQRVVDGLVPNYLTTPSSSITTITLTAAAESNSVIQLMWTQLPSAVSYKVYRDVTSGFTPSSTNEVISTATNITLRTPRTALVTPINSSVTSAKNMSGLTSGTRYYYKIAGVAANGSETYSNEANSVPATGLAVRTHAGQGVIGNTDADGYDAKFNFPQGLGVDSSGFIYLADSGNQLIRKISPRIGDLVNAGGAAYTVEGQATTLAGTGAWGNVNSSLPRNASFFDPWGSCVDSLTGNIYIADSTNHSIRQITPAGIVTTLAGANTSVSGSGILDGTGSAARFNYPQAIACDNSNVYVVDTYNNIIRQVTMGGGGVVTTLAGNVGGTGQTNQGSADGTGAAAKFYSPRGISGDGTALFTNLYISDSGNHTIRQVVRATGAVTTIAGSVGVTGKADGTGTAATFYNPRGITFSTVSSALYVADTNNHLIRKVTTAGVVTTVAGTGTQGSQDGVGIYTSFWYPQGIVFTNLGNGCTTTPCLYVSDTENHKIRRISGAGL